MFVEYNTGCLYKNKNAPKSAYKYVVNEMGESGLVAPKDVANNKNMISVLSRTFWKGGSFYKSGV